MDALFACFLIVGIVVICYIGLVVRRLSKKADKLLNEGRESALKIDIIAGNIEDDLAEYKTKINPLLDIGKEYMSVPPSAHLVDAGINFMAHIGAAQLGKGGLGLDKEQTGRVVMARNGFNVAGKRVGDGMHIPELLEKADKFGGLMGGGSVGGGEGGGGMDISGMIVNFLTGGQGLSGMMGGQGAPPPATKGGLPPV